MDRLIACRWRSTACVLVLALLLGQAVAPVLAAETTESVADGAGKVSKAKRTRYSPADDTAREGEDGADELPMDPSIPRASMQDLEKHYQLSSAPANSLQLPPPALPDLSRYTPATAAARINRRVKGTVSVGSLLNEPGFKSLTTAIGQGLSELAKRQQGSLRAIFIEHGYVSLPELAATLPGAVFQQVSPGVFVTRLPILVRHGATLEIGRGVKTLRLSQERGTMLAVEGTLYVANATITGWSESANKPTWFKKKTEFRPFIVGWGGSKMYIVGSRIAHLGYASTKAFGLSMSQYSTTVAQRAVWPRPTGWILNTEIHDLWYGYYCWEADDVVLRGNTFKENILYGIDPHDRSERLIIAENIAYGTRKKHGIIISREVNNSFIISNKSYGNALSGIVLDRQCSGNIIANNLTYQNRSDGIVLSESPNNRLWGNLSTGNLHHGIRLRNSTGIRIEQNSAIGNGLSGIYGVARSLAGTDRDFHHDPYTKSMSMTVMGGQYTGNGSGPINVEEPYEVALYDLDLRTPQRALGYRFGGVLLAYQTELLDILIKQKLVAKLERRPTAAPSAQPVPTALKR